MASISRKRPIRYNVPAARDLRRTYTSSVTNFRGIYNTETTIEMAPGAMNDACNVYVDEDYRLVTRKRLTPLFLPEKDVTVIDSVSLGDDIYAIIKDNTTGAEHEYAFLKLYPTKTYIDYRVTADSRLFVANNSIYITRCNSGDQFGVLLYNGTSVSSLTEGANIPIVYLDPTGRRIAVNEYGDASEALNIFCTTAKNGGEFRFSGYDYSKPYDLRGKNQTYIQTTSTNNAPLSPVESVWRKTEARDASVAQRTYLISAEGSSPETEYSVYVDISSWKVELWSDDKYLAVIRITASDIPWQQHLDGSPNDEKNIVKRFHPEWACKGVDSNGVVHVFAGISNFGRVEFKNEGGTWTGTLIKDPDCLCLSAWFASSTSTTYPRYATYLNPRGGIDSVVSVYTLNETTQTFTRTDFKTKDNSNFEVPRRPQVLAKFESSDGHTADVYHDYFVIQDTDFGFSPYDKTKVWVIDVHSDSSWQSSTRYIYAAEITFPNSSEGEYNVLALSRNDDEFSTTPGQPGTPAKYNFSFRVLASSETKAGVFKVDILQDAATITPTVTLQQDFTSLVSDGVEFDPIYTELAANDSVISFVANQNTLVTKYSRSFGSEASLKTINVYAYTTPILGTIVPGQTLHTFSTQTDGSLKTTLASGTVLLAYSESQLYGTNGADGTAYADSTFDITNSIGTALYTVWNDAREAMKNIDGVYSMNNCIIFTSGRNFAYSMTFSPKYVDPYSWEQMSSTDDKVLDILAISPTAAIMSTEKGMYWILGTGTGQLTHLKPVVSQFDIHGRKRGSFARRAMDDVPTIMCDDGVMMFVGTSEVTETAKNIATMSSAIFQKYDEFLANEKRRFTFRGRWYNMYCISTGAETKVVFFDVRSSAWWYWTLPIDAMKFFRSGDDLLALTSNGLIYKFTDEDIISNNGYTARYNDELVNVSFENVTPLYENLQYKVQWYIQTHPMSLGNTTKNKNMRDIVLALYPNETVKNFEMNVDFEVYTCEFTDGRPYITTEDIKELKVLLLRTYIPKFQYIAVRMYSKNDLSVYEKLQLRSLAFEYRILDRLN